jgi:hypothetical protein
MQIRQFFLILFIQSSFLFAQKEFTQLPPTLEIKASYFFFTNPTMRQIYDQLGYEIQGSGAYPIAKYFHVYGSVGFLQRKGKSLQAYEKTSLWQLPVDLGLKSILPICPEVKYYVAIGPRYFFVHQHNDSSYIPTTICRSGIGLFVNTGFYFFSSERRFFNLFSEYSYQPISFPSSASNVYGVKIDLGVLAFGAGLGYAF